MRIRQAKKQDLRSCLQIDPSYVTTRVWQMIEQQASGRESQMTFRTSRLPRPLRVQYPRSLTNLGQDMERNACFLVIEEESEGIRGFIDVTVEPDQVAYLRHLVIDEDYRHRGLGLHLLEASIAWAVYRRLRVLMAECQTKNYPATALYRKCGLKLCGYNDMLYANKDIALYFARELDS